MSLASHRIIQYIAIILILALFGGGYYQWRKSRAAVQVNQGLEDSLGQGLAGYWKLDDGSGTTAVDSSGNGNNGTFVNSPTWSTSGQVGGALSFDGANDYVTVPYSSSLVSTDKLSYSFWIKPDLNEGTGILGALNGEDGSGYNFIAIDNNGTELNNPSIGIGRTIGGSSMGRSVSFASPTNTWIHGVYTYDGSVERWYINGSKLGEWAQSGAFATNTEAGLLLGINYSTASSGYKGLMDEVRVYNRALSADEVSRLYQTTAPTGIDTGLVGYWPFDGDAISGTTAYDRSGNGNDGTLTNGPTLTEGKSGQALKFDGVNDSVNAGSATSLDDLSALTVSAWIYPRTSTYGPAGTLVLKGSTSGYPSGPSTFYNGWFAGFNTANPTQFQFGVKYSTANLYKNASPSAFTMNEWQYVTVTWDGTTSAGGIKMYRNGVEVSYGVSQDGSGSHVTDASSDLVMGINNYGEGNLVGSLDEVRIYNRALSAAEIINLYQKTQSDSVNAANKYDSLAQGLLGYWKLDDGSGTTAVDSSGNGNNGTLTNGPTWTTGQIRGATSFDGTDDYITMGAPSALNLTGDLTLSAWIYPKSFGQGSKGRVFDKNSSGSTGYVFFVDNVNHPNSISFCTNICGTSYGASDSITLNTWQHVVASLRGGVVTVYVNGSQVATGSPGAPSSSANNFVIGGKTTANDRNFDGYIDEARVYNRALSDDEVSRLYRTTAPTGIDTGLVGYWPFDGNAISGTTAYDRSGKGNDSTLTNGPAKTIGIAGQAMSFDGGDDYISTTNDFGNASTLKTVTVSAWFKTSSLSGHKIIGLENSKTGTGSTVYDRDLYIGTDGKVYFRINDGSNKYAISSNTYTDGNWHHAVGVSSGDSGDIKLYIDGALQQTTAIGTISTTYTSSYWRLGSYKLSGATNASDGYFTGSIDEPRVYNRILSAAEVQDLYQKTQPDSVNAANKYNSLAQGLLGYWKLDDGSGTTAVDSSGNGNNGTLTNGPTWTTGQIRGATSFDGTDDYITMGAPSALNLTGDLTLSAWIYPKSFGQGSKGRVFDKDYSSSTGYLFFVDNVNHPNSISFCTNFCGTLSGASNTITLNTWQHVVASLRGGAVTVYVNGSQVATGSPGAPSSSADNFVIGGKPTANDRNFDGYIDEARVYNRALSDDEVSRLYRTTAPTGIDTGLVGYWPFDGDAISGTTAYDRSGKGNNGTLTNGPTKTIGKLGQALSFWPNGTDTGAFVAMGDPASGVLDFGSGDFSVGFWMKSSGWVNQGIMANIPFSKSNNDFTDSGYLFKYDSSNQMKFIARNGVTDYEVMAPTATTGDNQWHHYIGQRSGSTIYLYIDGALASSTAVSGSVSTTSGVRIGDDGTDYRNVNGVIDEVRIYNRALSAAEIINLYNKGR